MTAERVARSATSSGTLAPSLPCLERARGCVKHSEVALVSGQASFSLELLQEMGVLLGSEKGCVFGIDALLILLWRWFLGFQGPASASIGHLRC